MEKRVLPVFLLVVALACYTCGHPADTKGYDHLTVNGERYPELEKLDEKIVDFLIENEYVGATLGVMRNGKLLYTQGYGTTTDGEKMLPTTLMHSSSISKSITAVAILKLAQEDRLGLDETIFGEDGILSHLRPLKHHTVSDPRVFDITVEHLLQHSGGWNQARGPIYDPLMNSLYLARGHNVTDIAEEMGSLGNPSHSDIIRYMMTQRLHFSPGTKYQYSNFGYMILGHVIEVVTRRTYDRYVRDEILTPLGMWRTRLGPHHAKSQVYGWQDLVHSIKFAEGSISLGNSSGDDGVTYDFLDSSLGWFSTVYDLLRFINGISGVEKFSQLTSKTLDLMLEKPTFSEHSDTWHGMGFRANNNNEWWQTGDPHDNEMVIYHGTQSADNTRKHLSWEDQISYVFMLSGNNRKNVRRFVTNTISSVKQWPNQPDLFITDCGDSVNVRKDGSAIVMKYMLPEHHIQAHAIALARFNYHPIWINGFTIGDKTFFSIILEKSAKRKDNPVDVFYELDNNELAEMFQTWPSKSLSIQMITSYLSRKNNGHIRHMIAVGSDDKGVRKVGWHEKLGKYTQRLVEWKENGQMPLVQSIKNYRGQNYVTLMTTDRKGSNWKSYTDLTKDELEVTLKQNAVKQRTLTFLDARMEEGEAKFSAVFSQQKLGGWVAHAQLSAAQMNEEISKLKGLEYIPKIIVGYEVDGKPYFAAMWTK
ncbi:uncharacterized protein [Ptychodera flava]|uniref:uncharacterized protein n=1 Tax=Ptychodera flava TaxID=63121 RepID=UPI00396A27B2